MVVAFHRPTELARLLESVHAPDREVVVVNVDADVEVMEEARRAGALNVPLAGNPGYAAAVNHGSRFTSGEIVVFMNDDLRVEPGCIEQLVAPIEAGQADVTLPAIMSPEGNRDQGLAGLPGVRTAFLELFLLPDRPINWLGWMGIQKWRVPRATEEVLAGTGALVAVRSALLLEEPLPEEYFLYWEEVEWFFRLHRRGVRVLVIPDAVVVHAGGATDIRPGKERLLMRNAVRCARRTRGPLVAAVVWPAVVGWAGRLLLTDLTRFLLGRGGRDGSARIRARLTGVQASILAIKEVHSPT